MRASEVITQSYLNGSAGLGKLPGPFENRFEAIEKQLSDVVHLTSFKRLSGETDDTGRLQRAIDSFTGNMAGTIIIADTIRISSQVTCHKTGLRLQGVSNKKSKIISTYSGISLYINPLYNGNPYRNSGYCKFYMDDIAIQAEGAAITSGVGMLLKWIYGSSFKNLFTSGFKRHVVMQGSHLNSFFNLYQENSDASELGIEIHNRGIGLSADLDPDEGSSNNNNVYGGWIHNTSWDLSNMSLTSVDGIDIEPASNSFILGYGTKFKNCRFERMDYYAVVNGLYPVFPWFIINGEECSIKDNIYGAGGANNNVNINPIFQVNSNYNEIDVPVSLSFNIGLMAFGPSATGNLIKYDAVYSDFQNTGNNPEYRYEVTSVKYNSLNNRIIYRDKLYGTLSDVNFSYSKPQGEFKCRSSKNTNIVNSPDWAYDGLTSSAVDIDLPMGRTTGDTAFTKLVVSSSSGNRRMYLNPPNAQTAPSTGVYTLTATVYVPASSSADLGIGVFLVTNTVIYARDRWITVRSRAYLNQGAEIIPTFQLYGNVGDTCYVGEISVCDGNVSAYVPNETTSLVSKSI
jgi:hypothetical protein